MGFGVLRLPEKGFRITAFLDVPGVRAHTSALSDCTQYVFVLGSLSELDSSVPSNALRYSGDQITIFRWEWKWFQLQFWLKICSANVSNCCNKLCISEFLQMIPLAETAFHFQAPWGNIGLSVWFFSIRKVDFLMFFNVSFKGNVPLYAILCTSFSSTWTTETNGKVPLNVTL